MLVFSTDPAHSLSDSFDEEIGEQKNGVAGHANLDGMEIDPGKWFEELKQRYRTGPTNCLPRCPAARAWRSNSIAKRCANSWS